jgi:hypothetical protein
VHEVSKAHQWLQQVWFSVCDSGGGTALYLLLDHSIHCQQRMEKCHRNCIMMHVNMMDHCIGFLDTAEICS